MNYLIQILLIVVFGIFSIQTTQSKVSNNNQDISDYKINTNAITNNDNENINNDAENNTKETQMSKEITDVSAQHILVKTEEKCDQILKEINDGKITFEDAARQHSMCPSGKQTNGDLGKFKKGMMVKEFEETAFSTEVGKIAKVKTQFGHHLIKVKSKS